ENNRGGPLRQGAGGHVGGIRREWRARAFQRFHSRRRAGEPAAVWRDEFHSFQRSRAGIRAEDQRSASRGRQGDGVNSEHGYSQRRKRVSRKSIRVLP